MGPAELFSVIHPSMLSAMDDRFTLTVGDVLALRDYDRVVRGNEILSKLSQVDDETYFLVTQAGQLALESPQGATGVMEVRPPVINRGGGCGDHRKH